MQILNIIVKILICINQVKSARRSNIEKKFLEDANLNTHQLIEKYKYQAETHFVKTEDDYILRVHRIGKPNGQPFFLMHGLTDSSATFVVTGPHHGLGYYLSDLGYDVWMGNARGNRYSRNHTNLNPNTDDIFWNFTWHEIGIYDLPAMIDYVLNLTKFEKLFYVGHSQGTTSFFVMCSKKPDYNRKIILMQALAPVALMDNFKSPFKFLISNLFKTQFSKTFPEIPIPSSNIFQASCKTFTSFCVDILFQIMGPNQKQLNMTILPVLLGHAPSTISAKQVHHYIQVIESKRFCEYDYGEKNNFKKYGKTIPPKYDINQITTPIVLYYSLNDYLTADKDVEQLSNLLPNVQGKFLFKKLNHIDFLWGIDAREIIFKRIGDEASKIISK